MKVLAALDHPGVVRYHEHFQHEDSLCVVMAYCEGGDLAKEIKARSQAEPEPRHFSEEAIIDWLIQVIDD